MEVTPQKKNRLFHPRELNLSPRFFLSTFVLVIANLIPVYGVLFWSWNASHIVVLYWMESFVIFTYTGLKIAFAGQRATQPIVYGGKIEKYGKIHYIISLIIIFVIFIGVYSVFLYGIVEFNIAVIKILVLPIIALFVSHGISFFTNYIGKGEYKISNPTGLLFDPLARIVFMGFAVCIGGGVSAFFDSPTPFLIVLVLLKIIIDVARHLAEHVKALRKSDLFIRLENAKAGILDQNEY